MMLDELRRTAEARGIATSFTDAAGERYVVAEATLEAVLESMGPAPVPAAWPPVVVTRTGRPDASGTWSPPEGEPATVVLESGEERPLPAELPGDLGDLAGLLAATAPLGAGFALLNPLHAAMPAEPSPYNPSSRVFRNPLYLCVEDVPELHALDPEA